MSLACPIRFLGHPSCSHVTLGPLSSFSADTCVKGTVRRREGCRRDRRRKGSKDGIVHSNGYSRDWNENSKSIKKKIKIKNVYIIPIKNLIGKWKGEMIDGVRESKS